MALQQNMYPITLGDAVSVLQKFELLPPSNSRDRDQQQQRQKDKQKDTSDSREKRNNNDQKEGVSLFQQDNGKSENATASDATIPEAEVQLLQQVVENDDDEDNDVHFLFTQEHVKLL